MFVESVESVESIKLETFCQVRAGHVDSGKDEEIAEKIVDSLSSAEKSWLKWGILERSSLLYRRGGLNFGSLRNAWLCVLLCRNISIHIVWLYINTNE